MSNAGLTIERFTSSEPGAWSNSYLISGKEDAVLFDVFMLRKDAIDLAEKIKKSGKKLTHIFVSHAHPDHFMGTEAVVERFPEVEVISTEEVVADVNADGPWMLKLLQEKLGPMGPRKLITPKVIDGDKLTLEGVELEIVSFSEGESKHVSTISIPSLKAHIVADLIYNEAHCYLVEKRPDAWLKRLDELERMSQSRTTILYPGHGEFGEPEMLIERTRAYLNEFLGALASDGGKAVEEHMLKTFPNYHAKQFLSMFTIPAYFPQK